MLAALPYQNPYNDKNDDRTKTASTQFVSTVSCK
jgi:hypothetical protein